MILRPDLLTDQSPPGLEVFQLTDEDVPSGALRRLRRDVELMKTNLQITPEEEQTSLIKLGLADPN